MVQKDRYEDHFNNLFTRQQKNKSKTASKVNQILQRGNIPKPEVKYIKYGCQQYKDILNSLLIEILTIIDNQFLTEDQNIIKEIELEITNWLFSVRTKQLGMYFDINTDF